MKLLTKAIETKLRANAKLPDARKADLKPVVKIFNPFGAATWLFTELDADGDTLFGLCDLGLGCTELGNVSLSELEGIKVGPFGLKLERDRFFEASKTLAEYAEQARVVDRIDA